MPGAVASSSSSADGGDNLTAKPSVKAKESGRTTRYRCPADFVSLCHKPCGGTLRESLENDENELWLIKAPAGFNPECFSGIKFPLSGLQTLKVPTAAGGDETGSGQQIYSILASSHCTSDLRLLTSDKQSSDEVVFGPAFSGLLNVCESYADSSANMAPQVIPAAPAPSIPPGLKQRFHPFGSKTPTLTCVADNEVDGATFGPSSTTLRPLVLKRFQEEPGHEEEPKKKKKKEKRIKMEREDLQEVVTVKVEPAAETHDEVMMELPLQEGDTPEKRKKKKKKKDRERAEVEEGVDHSLSMKVEEVTVKCEPTDTLYSSVEEGLEKKKKKKKRKSKTDDD